MKFYTDELGHMTKVATMSIYGKIFKKSSTDELGHMTKVAAMSIYGKIFKKSSLSEPIDRCT